MFQYKSGTSYLHSLDVRVKLPGMILLSLSLLQVNLYRILLLSPVLFLLQRKIKGSRLHPMLLLMPLIIFFGNFFSLISQEGFISMPSLGISFLRTLRFIYILWMAVLFTQSTDSLLIAPALYFFLKKIPFLPAKRISTQMGLSLTLLPVLLDEFNEIKDAMTSRCGWQKRRPLRNLYRMGLPLMDGILIKAECLADAMESRLYSEESTEIDFPEGQKIRGPLFLMFILLAILAIGEFYKPFQNMLGNLYNFY